MQQRATRELRPCATEQSGGRIGLSQPATLVPVEIEIFGFLEAEAAEMAAAEKAAAIMRD